MLQTVMLLGGLQFGGHAYINRPQCKLLAPAALTNNVFGDPVKVIRRLTPVTFLNVGYAQHHPVNRLIREILGIVQTFAGKNSDEAGVNSLVLFPRYVSIGI